MAILRYRNADGTIKEVVCLKGEKGDKGESGGATNAKELAYDGAEEYIKGNNVDEALKNTSNYLAEYNSHVHVASDVAYTRDEHDFVDVDGALNYIMDNLDNGGGGGATDASQIAYTSESYIGGSTVEEALDNASALILDNSSAIGGKADYDHTHDPYELTLLLFDGGDEPVAENVADAINYLAENQGSGGGSGGATDAKDITYHGESYIGGSTVEEALDNASENILQLSANVDSIMNGDFYHRHNASDVDLDKPIVVDDEAVAWKVDSAIQYLADKVAELEARIASLENQ